MSQASRAAADTASAGARVRGHLRVLLIVVVGSFLLSWLVALLDHHFRNEVRRGFETDLYPDVRRIEQVRADSALLDSYLARAIGEFDPLLLGDAQAKVSTIRTQLAALHAHDAEERQRLAELQQQFDAFAERSLHLVEDVLAERVALAELEARSRERHALRERLFERIHAQHAHMEKKLGDAFARLQRYAQRSLLIGVVLLVVVLVVVIGVTRVVGKAITRYTRRIAQQARHFSALYNETPAMLLTADGEGRCISVSEFFVRETGYRREEVLGRPVGELLLEEPRAGQEQRNTGRWDEYEARLKLVDGSWRDVLVRSRVQPDLEDEQRTLSVIVDITERKRAQNALLELNETLEQRVHERTAELTDAMARLQAATDSLVQAEKLAALGSLVAGVAHELNTPVGNAVMTASTLRGELGKLQAMLDGGLRRSQLEAFINEGSTGIDILLRNLERTADLIQGFKCVAVDQTSEQRRRFDLKQSVDELLLTLRPQLKNKPFRLDADILVGIEMDSYPGPIGQILTNFINNALLHAFEGRDSGRMLLSAYTPDAEHVHIEFADDGRGMNAEQLRRAFEPFYTTRLGQGGSGLGLSIAYNLTTGLLGGDLRVRPGEPGGVVFEIDLPRVAPIHG